MEFPLAPNAKSLIAPIVNLHVSAPQVEKTKDEVLDNARKLVGDFKEQLRKPPLANNTAKTNTERELNAVSDDSKDDRDDETYTSPTHYS